MTFREKLAAEHPNWDEEEIGMSIRLHCPHSYGYEDEKDSPCKPLEPSIIKCRECWDREIPGIGGLRCRRG